MCVERRARVERLGRVLAGGRTDAINQDHSPADMETDRRTGSAARIQGTGMSGAMGGARRERDERGAYTSESDSASCPRLSCRVL